MSNGRVLMVQIGHCCRYIPQHVQHHFQVQFKSDIVYCIFECASRQAFCDLRTSLRSCLAYVVACTGELCVLKLQLTGESRCSLSVKAADFTLGTICQEPLQQCKFGQQA